MWDDSKGYDEEARYFAKREAELREKRRQEYQEQLAHEERARLQEVHFMHCPKCGQVLKEVEHQGVPIDICPYCEGMWLDRGELEKIQQKSGGITGLFSRVFG